MKVKTFIQLKPRYDRYGVLMGFDTKMFRRTPIGGLTLELEINVPEKMLKAIPIKIDLPEDTFNQDGVSMEVIDIKIPEKD